MQLELLRVGFTDHSTEGEFYINGRLECYTLEDCVRPAGVKVAGETAIPYGRYKVVVNVSQRFGRRMPLLLGVPGFDGVRIHTGNKPADTLGCILVGADRTSVTDAWVGQSKVAYEHLLPQLERALASGEEIWLTIREAPRELRKVA